ncbi:hypothetical protein FACS1894204_11630 [Synergistales bacterium]|nr:hypothetical protein FACS1894204_11630 [Synergistales bacterium]
MYLPREPVESYMQDSVQFKAVYDKAAEALGRSDHITMKALREAAGDMDRAEFDGMIAEANDAGLIDLGADFVTGDNADSVYTVARPGEDDRDVIRFGSVTWKEDAETKPEIDLTRGSLKDEVMLTPAEFEELSKAAPELALTVKNDVRRGARGLTTNEGVRALEAKAAETARVTEAKAFRREMYDKARGAQMSGRESQNFATFTTAIGMQLSRMTGKPIGEVMNFEMARERYGEWEKGQGERGETLEQSMYKNPAKTIVEFRQSVLSGKSGKSVFLFSNKEGVKIEIASDDMIHINGEHNLTDDQWQAIIDGMDDIEAAYFIEGEKSKYLGQPVAAKINTSLGKAGVVLEITGTGRTFMKSAFFSTDNNLDNNWLKKPRNVKGEKRTPYALETDKSATAISTGRLLSVKSIQEALGIVNQGGEVYEQAPAVGSEAFKKWFGESKVVDGSGEPLVVYTGTDVSDIEIFDVKQSGRKSKTGAPEGSFFFTNWREIAESYTVKHVWMTGKQDYYENATVMPVYLSIKKPLKVNAKGENWQTISYKDEDWDINSLAEMAKNSGKYDGVIVTNVYDKGIGDVDYKKLKKPTTYVAFSPEQIKSVDNRGTWDAGNPNIYYQDEINARNAAPNAATRLMDDMSSIITLFETANVSSPYHEIMHHTLNVFDSMADMEGVDEQFRADFETILKENGVTRERFRADADARRKVHEGFARGFEAYLATGEAPSKGLRAAFARVRQWLLDLYGDVQQALGVELSSEMRDVYDRLLATPEEITAEAEARTTVARLEEEARAVREELRRAENEKQKTEDVISVTGKELGEFNLSEPGSETYKAELKRLREKAFDYYDKTLSHDKTSHPAIGEIGFAGKGRKKTFSNSANPKKLMLFPKIRELLKTARLVKTEENLKKDKNPNIRRFFTLQNTAVIGGVSELVTMTVYEDNRGNFYYNHGLFNGDEKSSTQTWALESESNQKLRDTSSAEDNAIIAQKQDTDSENERLRAENERFRKKEALTKRLKAKRDALPTFTANFQNTAHETL